jgi:hypothetical protein
VWYKDFAPLGQNPKLTPKWQGQAKVTEINETNARILMPNGKSKVLNVMRLKKFFALSNDNNSENDAQLETLDFNNKPKITGPVTRTMKRLLDQKNAAQLAINVLCGLSKQHCAICKWEQECSDNPLLFDPVFARQYIQECKAWLINKQSVCAICKLQQGQHLIDNQAHNDTTTAHSLHQQCQNFQSPKDTSAKDASKNENFDANNLIKLQNVLHQSQNLINALNCAPSDNIYQNNASKNLINTMDNEIFLINEELCLPLLYIANKLLGRPNLNFDQLTSPEQQLWTLFEKSDI